MGPIVGSNRYHAKKPDISRGIQRIPLWDPSGLYNLFVQKPSVLDGILWIPVWDPVAFAFKKIYVSRGSHCGIHLAYSICLCRGHLFLMGSCGSHCGIQSPPGSICKRLQRPDSDLGPGALSHRTFRELLFMIRLLTWSLASMIACMLLLLPRCRMRVSPAGSA